MIEQLAESKRTIWTRTKLSYGVAVAALAVACSTDKQEKVIPITHDYSSVGIVLKADDFEIRRIGLNLFKIIGDNPDAALDYISNRCETLSAGVWDVRSDNTSTKSWVVTVRDGNCLKELAR